MATGRGIGASLTRLEDARLLEHRTHLGIEPLARERLRQARQFLRIERLALERAHRARDRAAHGVLARLHDRGSQR